ncbi:MAG: hypothetical protein ACYTEQ_24675 [Planctomycetota bacterium]|jgi:hypothetical protein
MMQTAGGVLGTGLGVVGWPFERLSNLTAAVPAGLMQPTDPGGDTVLGSNRLWNVERNLRQSAKALWPFKKQENLPTWSQFWDTYYRRVAREKPPAGYSFMTGLSSEFLTDAFALGAMGKLAGRASRAFGVSDKLDALHPQAWKLSKLESRSAKALGIDKAIELGRTTTPKQLRAITAEMSRKLGKPVSSTAVQRRLRQVIKGSVTTTDDLAQVANPIQREFQLAQRQLQQLGVMGKTYVEPLTKAKRAAVVQKLRTVERRLKRLQTAPHYVGTPEISGRFPGRAKQITKLQDDIAGFKRTLKQSDVARGGEQYFPRLYETVEAERVRGGPAASYGKHRIKRGFAKQRQELSPGTRKAMGEMDIPTYPVTKRLIEESAAIENARLFKHAADNPGLASKTWRKGLAAKAIPDDPAYGALRGMYVHPRVRGDVTELVRMKDWWEAVYDSFIGNWKAAKVTWNPATHMRNMMSNTILNDLGGMDHLAQAKYAPTALKQMLSGSDEWNFARRYFGSTTTMRGEIMDDLLRGHASARGNGFSRTMDRINRASQTAHKYPTQIYQHEEVASKFMRYLWRRDQGMSRADAVMDANKWLIDYGDLSQFEKRVMRRVMPFYTFPRKAVPLIAEAAAKNPYALAKYPAFFNMMSKASMAKLDMSEGDYAQVMKRAPEYMQQGGYLLMPYRDNNEDLRFMDLNYIFPWGVMNEVAQRSPLGVVWSNPLVQLAGDVQRNKSSFTGRPIWNEAPVDSPREQWAKGATYAWQAMVPSLAPKGLYWDKLYDAATGTGKGLGQKGDVKRRLLPETVAHTLFGLRTEAVDPNMAKLYQGKDFNRITGQMAGKLFKLRRDMELGRITQEEFDRESTKLVNRVRDYVKEKR